MFSHKAPKFLTIYFIILIILNASKLTSRTVNFYRKFRTEYRLIWVFALNSQNKQILWENWKRRGYLIFFYLYKYQPSGDLQPETVELLYSSSVYCRLSSNIAENRLKFKWSFFFLGAFQRRFRPQKSKRVRNYLCLPWHADQEAFWAQEISNSF